MMKTVCFAQNTQSVMAVVIPLSGPYQRAHDFTEFLTPRLLEETAHARRLTADFKLPEDFNC
jgi:hypothetical protein